MTTYMRVAPSIQPEPVFENLEKGITTRVLSLKLIKQREYDSTEWEKEKSNVSLGGRRSSLNQNQARQPSKFLLGASMPNSVIKSVSQSIQPIQEKEDSDTIRQKRDAYVKEIINRLEPKMKLLISPNMGEDETEDDTGKAGLEDETSEKHDKTKPSIEGKQSRIEHESPKDPWEELKERRRVTRRTSILAPLSEGRRSTYESIKSAIDNSKVIKQLIDVDRFEEVRGRKLRPKQTGSKESDLSSMQSFGGFYGRQPSMQSTKDIKFSSSKSTKTRRKSGESKKKQSSKQSSRKSILKVSSSNLSKELKPVKTVSIIENKKEDSQTQTYLRLEDIIPKL